MVTICLKLSFVQPPVLVPGDGLEYVIWKQVMTHWWGKFELSIDQTARWMIGSLCLAVTRLTDEWQIQHRRAEPDDELDRYWFVNDHADRLADDAALERFFACGGSGLIQVNPLLADRAVVTRPVKPIRVPPAQRVRIFVSSPLWIAITCENIQREVLNMPIQRPSDTWFGASTWEGDVCYAARTQARIRLEDVPFRPHRAVTAVDIHNQGDQFLLLDRLRLPVQHLSVYADQHGMLWTDDLAIVAERTTDSAELRVQEQTRERAESLEKITEPREIIEIGALHRTISGIFG